MVVGEDQDRSSIWSIVSFLTFGFRARADEDVVTSHDRAARTCLTEAKSPAKNYVWTPLSIDETVHALKCAAASTPPPSIRKRRHIMKKGILVAIAALALAVFAVPEAQGNDGRSLDLRLSGSNFITSSEDGRPTPADGLSPLTSLASGIAKGSGSPLFSTQAVLEPLPASPVDYPPACLAMDPPMAGADISITTVLTYNDGSLLSLATGPDAFYCTDGVLFVVGGLEGIVTGGEGRFEGATGTFDGTAQTQANRATAHIMVDLD